MADPEDDSNDKLGLSSPQKSEESVEKKSSDKIPFVEVNADDEGDVSDISEEERNSTSSDHQKTRPKKKVKKKRRSKSFNSNDEETSSSDEDVSAIVANNRNKTENVNLASIYDLQLFLPFTFWI